jgi:multisubunit Na+/H+ antiporter MnhG subunit
VITSAALVLAFVLITSPLSAHAIAHAGHHAGDIEPAEGDEPSDRP